MREFFGDLNRSEAAFLVAVAVALIAWAIVGPDGVMAAVLPALAMGLLCGAVIGFSRWRRSSR